MKTASKQRDVNPWTDVQPAEVARRFSIENLDAQDLPLSEAILSAISAERYHDVKKMCDEFSRPDFGSLPTVFARKQFCALVAKVPFKGSDAIRERTALVDFLSAEDRCRRTNKRLAYYRERPERLSPDVRVVMSRTKEWVRRILGRLDDRRLGELIASSRPGGGVSIGTSNAFRVSLPYKLGYTDLCATKAALPYAKRLVEGSPSWRRLHINVDWASLEYSMPYVTVPGSRVTFVPKDARTKRTIAIEPALNVWLQLGVHEFVAKRLERFGNSITDQTRNQELARVGSTLPFGKSHATIDLSQASDSVSTELVRWVTPTDWFAYMADLRCEETHVKGVGTVRLEKFSSMGNGLTFVLETMIFYSMVKAVLSLTGGEVASCYGDDIIISDEGVPLLLEVLRFCGFKVNSAKSFVVGPFRESCGADWHFGYRVTPQYLRSDKLRLSAIYQLLNRADPFFKWGSVRDYMLKRHREVAPIIWGLENEDDTSALFTSYDYIKGLGKLTWNPRLQTSTFKAIAFKPLKEEICAHAAYAAALRGAVGSHYGPIRGRGVFRLVDRTAGSRVGLLPWLEIRRPATHVEIPHPERVWVVSKPAFYRWF